MVWQYLPYGSFIGYFYLIRRFSFFHMKMILFSFFSSLSYLLLNDCLSLMLNCLFACLLLDYLDSPTITIYKLILSIFYL